MKKLLLLLIFLSTNAYAAIDQPLNFTEEDGSPDTYPWRVKVTNGSLTDNGDGTISISTSGGAGTPGGTDRDIQFNDGGSFGGDRTIQWYKTPNTLVISRDSGQTTQPAIIISGDSNNRLANISHDGTAFFNTLQLGGATIAGGSTSPLFVVDNFGTRRFALDAYGGIYVGDSGSTNFPALGNSGSRYASLNFPANTGDKIYLYDGSDASRWGFGIQSWAFCMFMDATNPGTGRFSWRNTPNSTAAASSGTEVMNLYTTGTLEQIINVSTSKGHTIKLASSASANAFEIQDSSSNVLTNFDESGHLEMNNTATTPHIWGSSAQGLGIGYGGTSFLTFLGNGANFTTPISVANTASDNPTGKFYQFSTFASNIFEIGITSGATLFTVGKASGTPSQRFTMRSGTAGSIGLVISGEAAQTANLQEWRNSNGEILTSVEEDGIILLSRDATVVTNVAGEVAFDTNAHATGRGAIQAYDGTASTYVVAVQKDDTPSDGQVATWHTGGVISWDTASGGGHKVFMNFPIQSAKLSGDVGTRIDAGMYYWRALFEDSTNALNKNCLLWQGRMDDNWDSSSLTAKIDYIMISSDSTSTAGAKISWDVAIMAITSGDAASLDTESFDAECIGSQQVPTVMSRDNTMSIPITNSDSLAPGDWFIVKLRRDGSDTITGDAAVISFALTQ